MPLAPCPSNRTLRKSLNKHERHMLYNIMRFVKHMDKKRGASRQAIRDEAWFIFKD